MHAAIPACVFWPGSSPTTSLPQEPRALGPFLLRALPFCISVYSGEERTQDATWAGLCHIRSPSVCSYCHMVPSWLHKSLGIVVQCVHKAKGGDVVSSWPASAASSSKPDGCPLLTCWQWPTDRPGISDGMFNNGFLGSFLCSRRSNATNILFSRGWNVSIMALSQWIIILT